MPDASLCEDCLNAIKYIEVAYGGLYSYKRKDVKYNKENRCVKTGNIILLHPIVKCNQHRPRKKTIKKK